MRSKLIFVAFQILWAWACSSQRSKLPNPMDLSGLEPVYQRYQDTLFREFIEEGYVVSRKNGQAHAQGDSLLFTGIAMGILPCYQASMLFSAVELSATKNQGALHRFEPMPPSFASDPASRDSEIGALFGLFFLHKKCPLLRQRIESLWLSHIQFLQAGQWRVHPHGQDSKTVINPALRYVIMNVSQHMNNPMGPASQYAQAFELGMLSNVGLIAHQKMACYPVHLLTLQLILLEHTPHKASVISRKIFCRETASMNLPLTDWYCGRLDKVQNFFNTYQPSQYEYRHQRCPAWESENREGLTSASLDWMIMYRSLTHQAFREEDP